MTNPIPIRMGGYGPPTTGFSKSMKFIGDKPGAAVRRPHRRQVLLEHHGFRLQGRGNRVAGRERAAHARLPVVELSHRPRAGIELRRPAVPVPRQRACPRRDGRRARQAPRAGDREQDAISASSAGTRTASATSPTACAPSARRPTSRACTSACCRARSRSAPSSCSARRPQIMDLTDAIRMIKAGEIDAQENPLTNTVTYGVHKFHRFHTISNHFYISRPIFLHRPTFDGWPADLKEAMQRAVTESVAFQRELHVKEEEDAEARHQGARAARSSRSTPRSTTPSPRRSSRSAAEARKTPRRRAVQAGVASCPGRSAARSGALQTRDPGVFRGAANRGPGSAMHRFALHRVRDTGLWRLCTTAAAPYNPKNTREESCAVSWYPSPRSF